MADLGRTGASLNKMECSVWYRGPQWLFNDKYWPEKPELTCSAKAHDEEHPIRKTTLYSAERKLHAWDSLLTRKLYWNTLRITAGLYDLYTIAQPNCVRRKEIWALKYGIKEIMKARDNWVKKSRGNLVKDEKTNILKCVGRIQNLYRKGTIRTNDAPRNRQHYGSYQKTVVDA